MSENTGEAQGEDGDCGCGCGGSEGCAEKPAAPFQRRRKFIHAAIGVGAFSATLRSFPVQAVCNNLTGMTSPNHSGGAGVGCISTGMTPGFWANHLACWPTTISPAETFSMWFGGTTFPFSNETLKKALCPPNGTDNLAFQIAAGLLNAESSHVNSFFGYGSAQNFANSVIAAFIATNNNYSLIHDVIAGMNRDSGTGIPSWCGAAVSIC